MKLLVLLLISLCTAQCSKILFIAPMPTHSHFTLAFRLAKELADRGHEVTCINPYPQETAIKNYRDIPVVELVEYLDELKKQLFQLDTSGPVGLTKFIFDMGVGLTERTFMNKNVQQLLNSKESFDVAVMEHFLTDGLLGIAHHFNVPTILISPTGLSSLTNYFIANPAPSSYISNAIGISTKYMNFWERIQNLVLNILINLRREYSYMSQQRALFKKYIKSDVELDDLVYNVSLILENSHVSIHDAVPHVPAAIDIGGYHVSPPKKLPESLQSFLDNSENGVVLFSMGSNLKSKDLKPEVRESILKAFSKIKQNVLWKFEAELDNLPKNVKILKWIPQQDVLAHPNIRVFITHGGLLSTIETVHYGIPIIGIPVFGDQKSNIAAAVTKGYALSIPLTELTESRLSWALQEVLNNPKYRENAQKRARLINDRPLKPIDEAVYWVEHVIRHKGAPLLRSAALDLKWYQREMVDVFVFLIIVLLIVCVTVKKLFCLVYRKKPNISTKKKNK